MRVNGKDKQTAAVLGFPLSFFHPYAVFVLLMQSLYTW